MNQSTPTTTRYRHIEFSPYAAALGAVIHNVDTAKTLSDDVVDELLQAHAEFGVLFFRNQVLTPDDHIRFAEQLGEINVNRFFKPVATHPKIAEVFKDKHHTSNIGSKWHTDHSYDVVPAKGSILYALETPKSGGDTMFANMYLAWEQLSDGMRTFLSGMRAEHTSVNTFGKVAFEKYRDKSEIGDRLGNAELATQYARHPVGLRHPRSGRRALFVNQSFTIRFEGWTEDESKPLLQALYQHAASPEFSCRFTWEPGSIAFWDNRCTWHRALNDYPGQRRLMHRITLEGEVLEHSD